MLKTWIFIFFVALAWAVPHLEARQGLRSGVKESDLRCLRSSGRTVSNRYTQGTRRRGVLY